MDSEKELKFLSLGRLYNLQYVILKETEHFILNESLYDKNDIFNNIEKLIIINKVIKKKLNEKK